MFHKLIVANINIFLASYGSPRATVNIVGHDAFRRLGSSEGIVTSLGVSKVRVPIPVRGRDCFRNGSGAQPASIQWEMLVRARDDQSPPSSTEDNN